MNLKIIANVLLYNLTENRNVLFFFLKKKLIFEKLLEQKAFPGSKLRRERLQL